MPPSRVLARANCTALQSAVSSDEVRVTVIAAGFDGGTPPRRQPTAARQADLRAQQAARATQAPHAPVQPPQPVAEAHPVFRAPSVSDDELDVPDFLK